MTTQERVECPDCGKAVRLKLDGALTHHRNGVPDWPGSPWKQVCPASGRKLAGRREE
jgi:hypothetical protein